LEVARSAADPITDLVNDAAWREVDQRRALDFHRRRPQSADVSGVPLRSLWKMEPGGGWSISGGRQAYEDGESLALRATSFGRAALSALLDTMSKFELVVYPFTTAVISGEW